MLYLSMTHSTNRPSMVRFYPERDDSYEVQVFFGDDASFSVYMSADYARSFAEEILRVVPAPVEAQA